MLTRRADAAPLAFIVLLHVTQSRNRPLAMRLDCNELG
jgi:hypothetical protein